MPKKTIPVLPQIRFEEQTPALQIGEKNNEPLYEKAFLSDRTGRESEYDRNTTTWD